MTDFSGYECDVAGCETEVVGLDDGWKFNRGMVCQSCIQYHRRHRHWPDGDVEFCLECQGEEEVSDE